MAAETIIETQVKEEIRTADFPDIEGIYEIVSKFAKKDVACYGLSIEEKSLKKNIARVIREGISLVATRENKIVGVIGGLIEESMFDARQRICQEKVWSVTEDKRNGSIGIKLIKAFEKENKKRNVDFIAMGCLMNEYAEKLGRVYEKKKYELMEEQYIKKL